MAEKKEKKDLPSLIFVGDEARTRALELYPKERGQYDRQDAARHMLAAGILAMKYGPERAATLGKMHEYKTSPLKALGHVTGFGSMPPDYEQDMHNNALGIAMAKDAKSQKDLEALIVKALKSPASKKTEGIPWVGKPTEDAPDVPSYQDGGEVSTEEFIKKNVPRGTSEVPQLDPEGRLIDEREDIRSESQRMLNRLQSQPSKLPPGLRRTVAATRAQGKESMFPAAAPARDLLSGILGASPTAPGSEAYRTGQAIANMPPVQAAAAIPAKVAASAGDAATALAAMGPAMAGAVRPYGKGTVFSGVKLSSGRDVQSSLDRYIDQGKSAAFSIGDVNTADAVQKFFDTKARRYMSTQLGTEKDPIFDAIKKGRISNLALHDMRNLRKYAIEAAGEGKYKVDKETGKPVMDAYGRPIFYPKDPRAVMDVTEGYDEMVDVRPMSLKPGLIPQSYYTSDPLYRAEVERINDQMRQAFEAEGLDPRLVNFVREPMILTSARDTGKPYYSGYLHNLDDFIQAKLSGDPEATKNVPENVRRALDQGEIL
jgi:hypothetical protein